MPSIAVERTRHRLLPDARRVLAKPFLPGEEVLLAGQSRAALLMERILAIPEARVGALLDQIRTSFSTRHRDLDRILERHFELVAHHVASAGSLSATRRRLIGAYFTHEYSMDAAALSNPSLVRAPHQEGVATGSLRFIMSLRAIGEGHLSSIQFRSGVIDEVGQITLDETSKFARTAMHRPPTYEKAVFRAKLTELDSYTETAQRVLEPLSDHFSAEQLETSRREVEQA